jgi:hypothetical protein
MGRLGVYTEARAHGDAEQRTAPEREEPAGRRVGRLAGLAERLVGGASEGVTGRGDAGPPGLAGVGVEVPVDVPPGEASASPGGHPGVLPGRRTPAAGRGVDEA